MSSLHWFHTIPPSRPFLGIDGLNPLTRSLKGSSLAELFFSTCRCYRRRSFLILPLILVPVVPVLRALVPLWSSSGTTGTTFYRNTVLWYQFHLLLFLFLVPLVPLFRAKTHICRCLLKIYSRKNLWRSLPLRWCMRTRHAFFETYWSFVRSVGGIISCCF